MVEVLLCCHLCAMNASHFTLASSCLCPANILNDPANFNCHHPAIIIKVLVFNIKPLIIVSLIFHDLPVWPCGIWQHGMTTWYVVWTCGVLLDGMITWYVVWPCGVSIDGMITWYVV